MFQHGVPVVVVVRGRSAVFCKFHIFIYCWSSPFQFAVLFTEVRLRTHGKDEHRISNTWMLEQASKLHSERPTDCFATPCVTKTNRMSCCANGEEGSVSRESSFSRTRLRYNAHISLEMNHIYWVAFVIFCHTLLVLDPFFEICFVGFGGGDLDLQWPWINYPLCRWMSTLSLHSARLK